MAVKTSFPTAFQPFVFRDGSLGAVWLGIHVRHGVVRLASKKEGFLTRDSVKLESRDTSLAGLRNTLTNRRVLLLSAVAQ